MNLLNFLKWGNKGDIGKLIILLSFSLGFILFLNRYNFTLISNICIIENVKFCKIGFLQLVRSFLEHISFNFVIPVLFVIFSLGFDRLVNKSLNWFWFFSIGALMSIIITLIWEFQHYPVEFVEIIYDLFGVCLSYFFINWQLKKDELYNNKK